MRIIAQSSTPTVMFLMVSASDHVSGLTGLTPVVYLSKNGATPSLATNSATQVDATHMPGWYSIALTATETNTLGDIAIRATDAGATADQSDRLVFVQSTDVTGVNTAVAAVPANVWGSATRSLTTFDTLAADTATAVWSAGTRTLSSFGTLAADAATAVWGAATRTLSAFGFSVTASSVTDKTGYALTSAYDAAKTAASATAVAAIPINPALATDSRLDNLDATVSSRLAASGYAAAPSAADIVDYQLGEEYPADGQEPTLRQALYAILAVLTEKQVSGTTMTVKKLDGTTTAMTFSLDSATAPKRITRIS